MSTAIALNSPSRLPATFSHMLATPSEAKVEQLWWQFQGEDKRILETVELFKNGRLSSALILLLRSSQSDLNAFINCSINGSSYKSANKILQQEYWQRALKLTDVLYHMPTKRKQDWNEDIKGFKFPEFTLENLVSTLSTLLSERDMFVAERVDGVFKALSGDHLTNSSSGFYKRMILAHVHDEGSANSSQTSYVDDLRVVIARLTGREGEDRMGTYHLIEKLAKLKYTGQWVSIDGGAVRIRVYKKGTAHIEIHEDLAWQLNEILAILYPKAIPSEFRQKPKKKVKEFVLSQNLIGFDVLDSLREVSPAYDRNENPRVRGKLKKNTFTPRYPHSMDKHLRAKVCDILRSIGGVELAHYEFEFDYDPTDVLDEIFLTGSFPDHVSHQFFETPEPLAKRMSEKLGQQSGGKKLEPEAGQGSLAQFLVGDVTCVEVSKLHCKILESKGFKKVVNADFLEWAKQEYSSGTVFDEISMNPPFSQGRSTAHLEAAFSLLKRTGVLVALVTESVARKFVANGFNKEIESISSDEFRGVSVDLCIMTLTSQEKL